jgi:cobalt/nickel transport system permease protein
VSQFHKAISGIDHLERLGRASSPIHNLSCGGKLAVTFVYIVFVISYPVYKVSGLIPFVLYPALMMPLSGTPWKPMLTRTACALPFAFFIGLSNMILVRQTAFYIGPFGISYGMVSFASIMLKTALCVFAVLLLVATTRFTCLAARLTASRGLRIIGLQIVLTYRYIATLAGEASDMMTAYILRSGGLRGLRIKDMGTFCGQLLLRSFDKAGRVYYAMKCRGFRGAFNSEKNETWKAGDWVFTIGSCAAFIVLRFFNLSRTLGALL